MLPHPLEDGAGGEGRVEKGVMGLMWRNLTASLPGVGDQRGWAFLNYPPSCPAPSVEGPALRVQLSSSLLRPVSQPFQGIYHEASETYTPGPLTCLSLF